MWDVKNVLLLHIMLSSKVSVFVGVLYTHMHICKWKQVAVAERMDTQLCRHKRQDNKIEMSQNFNYCTYHCTYDLFKFMCIE